MTITFHHAMQPVGCARLGRPQAKRHNGAVEAARRQRVVILGSTGSIGTQALEVIAANPDRFEVVGLAAGGGNPELLDRQRRQLGVPKVAVAAEGAADTIGDVTFRGPDSAWRLVEDVAATTGIDVVLNALVGALGLRPTLAALATGARLALANKESLVAGGPLVLSAAQPGQIVPVDSEHSALAQCLRAGGADEVERLVLTASGGPFRDGPEDLDGVTPEQALRHPNWAMGPKVTIDSATLFNKGLEVLEAHYLFELPLDRIEVVVHPQSLVHGLVRFRDGNVKAQIGPHDMRLPIQYALAAPERPATPLAPLPLLGAWQFLRPDVERFPSLPLAYRAGERGGVAPAYLNAADEVAVTAFLEHRLGFAAIPRVLETVLAAAPDVAATWDSIASADVEARRLAHEALAAVRP